MATKREPSSSASKLKIQGTNLSVDIDHDLEKGRQLDWNLLGTIMIKYLEDDVAKVPRVDFKYGTGKQQKSSKDSKMETEWVYDHRKHDIMVFKKKLHLGSPYTCWMGRGIVEAPLREVAEFIKDVQNNMSWDDLLIEARYLKVLSQSDNPVDFLGYQRFEKSTCLVSTHRDFLYFVRCLYKGNMYIQAGLSVDDPDFPPPPGVKRVEARLGSGWVMEPYQGHVSSKTLVTYVANTDLKGLPVFMMNHVLKRHPLALYYIRRQLTEPMIRCHTHESPSEDEYDANAELTISKCDNKAKYTSRTTFEEEVSARHFIDDSSYASGT